MNWNNDWTGFFLVYFKWCYYLCVTPFRFEWDERAKKFRVERNRIQRAMCALQYILLGFWYLKDLRKIPVDSLYKNPVVYFSLAFNLNAIYYHGVVLVASYWKHEDRYLALVNFDCTGYAISCMKKRLLAGFLCFLFAILPLLYSVYGYQILPSSRPWDISLMLRCLVAEGRFALFLSDSAKREPCNDNHPPEFSELFILDFVVALLAFLMEVARQIMGFYSDFFPLLCCISVWTSIGPMREFLDAEKDEDYPNPAMIIVTGEPLAGSIHLRRVSLVDEGNTGKREKTGGEGTSGNLNRRIILPYITQTSLVVDNSRNSAPVAPASAKPFPMEMERAKSEMEKKEMMEAGIGMAGCGSGGNFLLERYEICKAFSRTVNRALGQILFAYVLSSIMYLSTCMDAVLVLQDWFGKLRVAFFFFVFILIFFIGSEIVNKVYGVRAWLSDSCNNVFLSERNLLVLIHEVTCKSIGICGNGMFTITYSTFMTVMTSTVTFFIIILQFQKPNMVLDKVLALLENVSNTTLSNAKD